MFQTTRISGNNTARAIKSTGWRGRENKLTERTRRRLEQRRRRRNKPLGKKETGVGPAIHNF